MILTKLNALASHAGQTVALYFRPTGSKVWQQAAHTTTDANGYYRLSAGPGRWSGTWYVGFTAPGAWYLNAAGPSTWVGMH